MYTKDGESYFVVDSHITTGTPARQLGAGSGAVRQGLDRVLHAYMGLAPAETHWPLETRSTPRTT